MCRVWIYYFIILYNTKGWILSKAGQITLVLLKHTLTLIILQRCEWYRTFPAVISTVLRMNVTADCGTRRYNSRLPYQLYQDVQQIRGGEPCKATVKRKIQNSQKNSFRKWIQNCDMPDSLICKFYWRHPVVLFLAI